MLYEVITFKAGFQVADCTIETYPGYADAVVGDRGGNAGDMGAVPYQIVKSCTVLGDKIFLLDAFTVGVSIEVKLTELDLLA